MDCVEDRVGEVFHGVENFVEYTLDFVHDCRPESADNHKRDGQENALGPRVGPSSGMLYTMSSMSARRYLTEFVMSLRTVSTWLFLS